LLTVPFFDMFLNMQNIISNGTLKQHVIESIRRRLPPGWSAEELVNQSVSVLRLSSPDNGRVDLRLIARKGLLPRDVPLLPAPAGGPVLVVSPYLGARTRELLAQAGTSYADATGNVRIVANAPAVFLEGVGAKQDPERTPRPLHSLRGSAASRVVRALVELELPLGVRALATAAATPLGTVSRVVSFLENEALLKRDDKKRILTVAWPDLLRRWAEDYDLTRSNELHTFLEPRGLSSIWAKLERLPRYAVTGSLAGPGIASTQIAMLYVDDPPSAARLLGVVPAEAGANVWLLRPYDEVVFTRTRRRSVPAGETTVDTFTVSAAQAVVDLMTTPGRGPQEAEVLVEKMTELPYLAPTADTGE
jgi:hypothetical protein